MNKNENSFKALGLVSAAVCFFGMYLDIKHEIEIGKILVIAGFLVTGLTYILGKKSDDKASKAK